MNKKIKINLLLGFISLFVAPLCVLAVSDTSFDNAKITINQNNTPKLSDDTISITNTNNPTGTYYVRAANTKLSSDIEVGSFFSTVEGKKSITKVNDEYTFNLDASLKTSSVIYVTIFAEAGGKGYEVLRKDIEVKTPLPKERLALTGYGFVEHSKTFDLSDDTIYIPSADLGDLTKYKAILIEDGKNITINENDTLDLTGITSTSLLKLDDKYDYLDKTYTDNKKYSDSVDRFYTIDNAVYKEFATKNDGGTLLILYDGKYVAGAIHFNGIKNYTDITKIEPKLKNLDDSQKTNTKIELQFKGITLENPGNVYALFSNKIIQDDMLSTGRFKVSGLEGNAVCEGLIRLQQIEDSNPPIYELADKGCVLPLLEKKEPTYVTLYASTSNSLVNISCEDCAFSMGGLIDDTIMNSTNVKKLTVSSTLPRPELLPMGTRIVMDIKPESSLFYFNELSATSKSASYTIGLVEDKALLRDLRDNKSGSFEALLKYAKNAKAINSGEITIKANAEESEGGEVAGALYSQTEIQEGKYYFLYAATTGTEYYPVEDVHIYRAVKNSDGKIELVAKDKIEWEDIDEPEEKKVKNSKTGIASYTLLALSVSALAVIVYLKTKNLTKFPQS